MKIKRISGLTAGALFLAVLLLATASKAKVKKNSVVNRGTLYYVGDFDILCDANRLQITSNGKNVWTSKKGTPFVQSGIQNLHATENRGSFIIEENIQARSSKQTIDSVYEKNGALIIRGVVSGNRQCESGYTLRFYQQRPGHLTFDLQFDNTSVNLSQLVYESTADERFHGFGEQFSILNMKGRKVPVLSQEGGVGRGHQPISSVIDIGSKGSAGNALTTYYAVPQYITNTNKSLFLENTDYAVFDLTNNDQVTVSLFQGSMTGRILAGDSMLELIERFTEYTGRMRPLPDWFNQGAIVGMQGGTQKVSEVFEALQSRGTPIAGFWLQDWVGKRQTSMGSQLWWNWELDYDRYPDWHQLVDDMADEGCRMLGYINPFLVDASPKGNVRRNLYQEALENDYLVMHKDGSVLEVTNTDFDAGMVDLTNPHAVKWMKAIIKDQLIDEGRFSGWMHDFAEALPLDAVLYSGESAATYHNQYAVDWAKLAREAITEAGMEKDIVFFNRSGAAKTPGYSTLLWQGDQLTTWDKYDGMKTAIMGLLTGGFSGISLNHSDIGGYTNVSAKGIGYDREKELLLRWMELSAFTVAYRTHEGLKPEANAQFYDDEETYNAFDKFARVYKAMAFYRKKLMNDAYTKGYPVVRHPMLHYPNDTELAALTDHLMLGDEILFAPIINKTSYNNGWKKVYFPNADTLTWIHMFTGKKYGKDGNTQAPWWLRWSNPARGNQEWVYAPVGTPAAFYKKGSAVGAKIEQNLRALGVK